MGYNTFFDGTVYPVNKPFDKKITDYINKFASVRHMSRDVSKIKETNPEWEKDCWNGFLGSGGEYYIGDDEDMMPDGSVYEYDTPPRNCPDLWCQWVISDGRLMWNQGEKFYDYIEWLQYLIDNFFAPSGYILAGDIRWQGEEMDDRGIIHVAENKISIKNL